MDLLLLQSLGRLEVLAWQEGIFPSLSRRSALCINVPIQLLFTVACWELHQASRVLPGVAYPTVTLLLFFTEIFTAVISFRAFPRSVQSIQSVRWNPEKLLVGSPSTRLSFLVPALSIQFESPLLLPKAPIQTTSSTVNGMQLFLAHPKILEKNQSPRGKPS